MSADYRNRHLDEILAGGYIGRDVYGVALQVARHLGAPNGIHPSISPDDGGVVFYWVAGSASIEIDIEPDGSFWWCTRSADGESASGFGAELPLADLKVALDDFVAYVARARADGGSK